MKMRMAFVLFCYATSSFCSLSMRVTVLGLCITRVLDNYAKPRRQYSCPLIVNNMQYALSNKEPYYTKMIGNGGLMELK